MARNQNTFAKLQREAEKKAKARAKQARRKQRKLLATTETEPGRQEDEPHTEDEST